MTSIFVDDATVDESQTFVDVVVRLDAASTLPISVLYSTFSGTASTNTSDIVGTGGTLNFAAGETIKTVRVTFLPDQVIENTENFILNISNPTNAFIGRASGTITIIDNDAPSGTPLIAISDFVVDEADREARFVITLDRPGTSTVSFNYATQDGTANAGSDFIATSGLFNLNPGETARTVVVPLLNDTVAESNESFSVVLSNLVNSTSLDPVGTAVIWANDSAPVSQPSIFVDDLIVDESQAYADVIIRLSAPSNNAVSVLYSTFSGTASTNTSDIVGTGGTLNFAAGETVKTVRVTLLPDQVPENNETFTLNISNPTNALIGRASGTITIIDNDAPSGTPVIAVSDLVVDEADREAHFVITLDRPSTSVVSFNYTTQNGTANAGSDFVATSGSFNLAPGEIARTVVVPLINDTVAEVNERFSLVLSNLVNVNSAHPLGTATIWANDSAPVAQPSIFVDDLTVDESQLFVDVIVRLNTPSNNTVSVVYSPGDRTTSGNSDYTGTSGTLNFAAGETVKTVHFTLLPDLTAEGTETFGLNLSSPINAVMGRARGNITIIDNDAPSGTPVISVSDFVVDEADREARFVITLDRPSTSTISFNYATQDGTANAGSDFTTTNGSFNLAPGETARTVIVPLLNETLAEGNESFSLVLSNLVNATFLDPVGTAVIWANDSAPVSQPSIFVDDPTFDESQTYADVIVYLNAPSNKAVSLTYSQSAITAGGDYFPITDTLNFAAGETAKTVRLTLIPDFAVEGPQTFAFNLLGPTNAIIGRAKGIITIYDNDGNTAVTVSGGNDTYNVIDSSTLIPELSNGGTDTVKSTVTYTLPDNVENLELLGTLGINGFGNTANNLLTGNAAENTLAGGAGNDTLNGGGGVDTAVFSGPRASYQIQKTGQEWQVVAQSGTDGSDRLISIENLSFSNLSLSLLKPALTSAPGIGSNPGFLFDPVYYLLDNSQLVPTITLNTAVQHYFSTGAAQGEKPNSWFDPTYYANRWADLKPLNLDAATLFQHYNLYGVWEGRSAGPKFDKFDGNRYLTDNPDVAAYVDAFIGDFLGSRTNGAIAHYVIYGSNEGRTAFETTGSAIDLGYIL